MLFEIDKKTGFSSKDLPVIILDESNNLFYTSKELNNFKGRFNLPSGKYQTNNTLKKLEKPLNYVIVLPKFERNFNTDVYKFRIMFGENINKCTIFHNRNTILFDNSFLNKSKCVLYTILEHEHGHKYYFTEWKADIFAFKKMLELGYNPSQIKKVFLTILNKTESNLARMQQYFNIH